MLHEVPINTCGTLPLGVSMLPTSERSKVRLDIRDTDEAFGVLRARI